MSSAGTQVAVGTSGWALLGEEPVPGDPDAVRALADGCRRAGVQAASDAQAVVAHAGGVGASGWAGQTATAYAEAIGRIAPEIALMVGAADGAAVALAGYAEVMTSLQATAAGLLEVATQAEQDRVDAVGRLATLHDAIATRREAHEDARRRWAAAEQEAAAALAIGDATAPDLQAHAARLWIAVNDALAAVALLEAQATTVGAALTAAEQLLADARADAARLGEELRAAAAATAGGLQPVPPLGRDIIPSGPSGGSAPTAPAPAPPPPRPAAPAGGSPAPAAPTPQHEQPPPPVDPPAGTGASDGPSNPPQAALVRVASILAMVRAGGVAVPVADVIPSREVFDRYRRIGLQPVTARGAAIARALGFEGTIGGLGWRPTPTDHSTGLAIDLMTYDDTATGEALARFFAEHHEELGVTYVIWNGQIISGRNGWVWRPYTHPAGRTDPTAMHLDHVHVSFDPADNAYACACFGVQP